MTDNQESKELEQKGGDLSDKLLDCPFCGRLGGIITWTDNFAGGCKCGCQLIPKKSLSEAIESWNTRASSKQLTTTQQALDSAVEALKESKSLLEQYWDEWDTYDTCGYLGIPIYDETVRIIKQIEAALASIKE